MFLHGSQHANTDLIALLTSDHTAAYSQHEIAYRHTPYTIPYCRMWCLKYQLYVEGPMIFTESQNWPTKIESIVQQLDWYSVFKEKRNVYLGRMFPGGNRKNNSRMSKHLPKTPVKLEKKTKKKQHYKSHHLPQNTKPRSFLTAYMHQVMCCFANYMGGLWK